MDGSPFSEYASPHARGRTMPAHECCVTKGVPRRSSCSGRACAPRQMRGPLCRAGGSRSQSRLQQMQDSRLHLERTYLNEVCKQCRRFKLVNS